MMKVEGLLGMFFLKSRKTFVIELNRFMSFFRGKERKRNKYPSHMLAYFLVCFLVIWVLPTSAKAIDSTCSYKEINRLQKLASHITYQYENDLSNNFLLTIKHVTAELYLKSDNGVSYYWDPNENNMQSVFIDGLEGGKTYTFRVYTYGSCKEEKIRTIYINLPKVNPYASRQECQGLNGFSLCNKWTNTDNLSEETFLKRLDEYKKQQDKGPIKKEEPFIEKISASNLFIKNYDLVLLFLIFASLTVISILKLKERKKRNKLL